MEKAKTKKKKAIIIIPILIVPPRFGIFYSSYQGSSFRIFSQSK